MTFTKTTDGTERTGDRDQVRVDLPDTGQHRQRDREEPEEEPERDLRGRVQPEEQHQRRVPHDRRHGVQRGHDGAERPPDEPIQA
jgi:hypothetical protein